MLDINLVFFGKIKDKNYQAIANEYLLRLKPYARVKIIELASSSFSKNNHLAIKKAEADKLSELLLKYSNCQVILMDEAGVSLDSLTFAQKLAKINGPILMVVGGTLGFSKEIKQNQLKWSLSPLTMPHELARVVLMEQLYRAATIISGKAYHY